jgi:translation initiation factor IF-2
MSDNKPYQLAKVAKILNVGLHTIVERLHTKGHTDVLDKPTTKITEDLYQMLCNEFATDRTDKEKADKVELSHTKRMAQNELDFGAPIAPIVPPIAPVAVVEEPKKEPVVAPKVAPELPEMIAQPIQEIKINVVEKVNLDKPATVAKPEIKKEPAKEVKPEKIVEKPEKIVEKPEKIVEKPEKIERKTVALDGVKVLDSIDLDADSKKAKAAKDAKTKSKPETKIATPTTPQPTAPVAKTAPVVEPSAPEPKKELPETELIQTRTVKLSGPTDTGEKIDLSKFADTSNNNNNRRGGGGGGYGGSAQGNNRKRIVKDKKVDIAAETKKQITKEEFRKPTAVPLTPGRVPGSGYTIGTSNAQSRAQSGQTSNQNRTGGNNQNRSGGKRQDNRRGSSNRTDEVISEEEIQNKIRETMAKLAGGSLGTKGKPRPKSKNANPDENDGETTNIIELTEFITVNELASLMDIQPTEIIKSCFKLGVIVSINQRIDAEIIELVSSEFGFEVKFISLEESEDREAEDEALDHPDLLTSRAPIVTIMGHVDHGKTSLLDYIRSANVVAGEMGGITQHIGAYEVTLANGKEITFLDTPGHEAFTAMRARGAKLTDIAVIVVAADDAIMPQTKEAISHAQAASVPIIFAINKIDKDGANAERIKEQLANMNLLVEEWGGKIQSQDISAKKGLNIDKLLEKILLEAEILELKANPDKPAVGSVIEASLDKGRGYVANIMVQSGTLKAGDMMVAGSYYGRVKAMGNERGVKIAQAGPSTPVMVLGLSGAPQAGDKFKVYANETEAKDIANRRQQLQREQGLRAHKHITLEEIGRRLALGNFKELRLIVKGDVDGSVEALSDSLIRLSTESIQINVINKAVGQISETDVMLATASDAIIIGFNVRPSLQARKTAEREAIEIRTYSIIYDAIEEVKAAMEGLMEPKYEEKIVCQIEVREVFKIPKVGTIAGCYVQDGKMMRNTKVRVIRDGIVLHTGELASLKRYKDDVKEVTQQMECGLNLKSFNEIAIGDTIEGFEEVQVKAK